MKLVLKYAEDVRLYTEPLTYQRLITFLERQFEVEGQKADITFTDEDGDSISIASEDDIAILETYFTGKQYVKLNVAGPKKEKKPTIDEVQTEEKLEKKDSPVKKKKAKSVSDKKQQKPKKQAKEGKQAKEAKQMKDKSKQKKDKKEKEKKPEAKAVELLKFLSAAVSELVDERLRAMVPCLRQQLSHPADKKEGEAGRLIVHANYECSHCFASPIVGIRYECPVCVNYNVCQVCERSNQHQHNLIKIRHLVEKPAKKQQTSVEKLCSLFLERTEQLSAAAKKEKEKKLQQKMLLKEKLKQAMRYLSQLFGNEPAFFKDFVKDNKKLPVEDIIKAYAAVQSISSDSLQERVIDLQCQRLSDKFHKEANLYKDFVREHFSFDLKAIIKCIYEKGVEQKPKKGEKKEEKPLISHPVAAIEAKQVKEQKKEEEPPKIEKSNIKPQEAKLQAKPKKESSQLKGGKQQVLNMMIEFFGEGKEESYRRFIAANEKYSKEDIVQMWADSCSVINP